MGRAATTIVDKNLTGGRRCALWYWLANRCNDWGVVVHVSCMLYIGQFLRCYCNQKGERMIYSQKDHVYLRGFRCARFLWKGLLLSVFGRGLCGCDVMGKKISGWYVIKGCRLKLYPLSLYHFFLVHRSFVSHIFLPKDNNSPHGNLVRENDGQEEEGKGTAWVTTVQLALTESEVQRWHNEIGLDMHQWAVSLTERTNAKAVSKVGGRDGVSGVCCSS